MQGKISFGVDFIYIMAELNARARQGFSPTSMAAALLFLLEWDLNSKEVDEANSIFWERNEREALGDIGDCANRLILHVKDHQDAKSRLIRQMVAIASLDFHYSEDEVSYVRSFSESLDMRPSEFGQLVDRGHDLAQGLAFFGEHFQPSSEAD